MMILMAAALLLSTHDDASPSCPELSQLSSHIQSKCSPPAKGLCSAVSASLRDIMDRHRQIQKSGAIAVLLQVAVFECAFKCPLWSIIIYPPSRLQTLIANVPITATIRTLERPLNIRTTWPLSFFSSANVQKEYSCESKQESSFCFSPHFWCERSFAIN